MSEKSGFVLDGRELTVEELKKWAEEMKRTHPEGFVPVGNIPVDRTLEMKESKWKQYHNSVAYTMNGVKYNIHGNPVEPEGCILI